MENQHRKISGYRELAQEEIDVMNEIKAVEQAVLALHTRVVTLLVKQQAGSPEAMERHLKAGPQRWAAIARTDFETGFMALIRSVAQPTP